MQTTPAGLEQRRQDAITRDLAGDPMAAICRELGCSKSWLYQWKQRSQVTAPTWARAHSRRPETTPTKTPQAVEMELVRLRDILSPSPSGTVSAHVIRDRLRQQHLESIPSLRTIDRILKRHTKEVPSYPYPS
jgi:transposase-like protein